jgi:hypothetical protein
MKQSTLTIASAHAALALIFLSSCSKGTLLPPPEIVNGCPITSFGVILPNGNLPDSTTVTFHYNNAGQLLEMTAGAFVTNAEYDYHFRYDALGRLTDYVITGAGLTGAFVWHRYSYPDAKTIVDSSYDYVGDIDGPPPTTSSDIYADILQLDDEDRVVVDSNKAIGTTHYQYDRNGDLIRPGVTYDRKVNLLRTNYLLMLIVRDFSLNNPLFSYIGAGVYDVAVQISGYNSAGLPEQLTSADDYFPGIGIEFSTLQITYGCDQKEGGSKKF